MRKMASLVAESREIRRSPRQLGRSDWGYCTVSTRDLISSSSPTKGKSGIFAKKINVLIFRKALFVNKKSHFLALAHLFSPKNLPFRTSKSVASREFLGKVVEEQAVVPPINGNSYLG